MSTIIFQQAGMSDLTIEHGRTLPLELDDITINQERYLTEDNKPKVVDYGDDQNIIRMHFKSLTKDNFDGTINGLRTWFQNALINWSQFSFTMVDEAGATHTVRYWTDKFRMPMAVNGLFSITFELLKEG